MNAKRRYSGSFVARKLAYAHAVSFTSRVAAALKPEYVFQPRVLMRRLRNGQVSGHGPTRYEIPGGATIEALADEEHGRILATLGRSAS
jgi:hypothetical protein